MRRAARRVRMRRAALAARGARLVVFGLAGQQRQPERRLGDHEADAPHVESEATLAAEQHLGRTVPARLHARTRTLASRVGVRRGCASRWARAVRARAVRARGGRVRARARA
eukprot:3473379-Prymnesium_polylepis.1